jgi:hypothetical protein
MQKFQILLLPFLINCFNCQHFSDLDLSEVLLNGQQAQRIEELNYLKACKCQCIDKTVFAKERNRSALIKLIKGEKQLETR